jgi:hypothetical protein
MTAKKGFRHPCRFNVFKTLSFLGCDAGGSIHKKRRGVHQLNLFFWILVIFLDPSINPFRHKKEKYSGAEFLGFIFPIPCKISTSSDGTNPHPPNPMKKNIGLYNWSDPYFKSDQKEIRAKPEPAKTLWFNPSVIKNGELQTTAKEIEKRRQDIHLQLLTELEGQGTTTTITTGPITKSLLQRMVELYNVHFFDAKLFEMLIEQKTHFSVDVGLITFQKGQLALCANVANRAVITVHQDINVHELTVEEPEACNGIICSSRLELAQVLLEHECIHLIIDVGLRAPANVPSHGTLFQKLAFYFFGHTRYTHEGPIRKGGPQRKRKMDEDQGSFSQKVQKIQGLKEKQQQIRVGSLVFDSKKNQAMVVRKTQNYVSVLLDNGSIQEKVSLEFIYPGAQESGLSAHKLNQAYQLFSKQRKACQIGARVHIPSQIVLGQGPPMTIPGQIVEKKPCRARIRISMFCDVYVSYHLFTLV